MGAFLSTSRTSLARARGSMRGIVLNAQRLNERQPMPVAEIGDGRELELARYLLEAAEFHYSSACYDKAAMELRNAFAIAGRYRWVSISERRQTPIVEPERFLGKLMSCQFLDRAEYRAIQQLLTGKGARDYFELERMRNAVAKVINGE